MAKRLSSTRRSRLEGAKRESVAQLLFKCARLVNERAMARVDAEAGTPVLKSAYTSLFPHLDFEGVRIVELAKKLGISKQAVSHTVAELVEHGVVELIADPADGRAKRVRFTPRGAEAISRGLAVLRELEHELASQIGEPAMRSLHANLLALEAALEPGARGEGVAAAEIAPPKPPARKATRSRRPTRRS